MCPTPALGILRPQALLSEEIEEFVMAISLPRLAAGAGLSLLVATTAFAQSSTTTTPSTTAPATTQPAAPAGDPVVAVVNGKELHRSDVIASAQQFQNLSGRLQALLCNSGTMPHAEVPFKKFWTSTNPYAPALLKASVGITCGE